VAVPVAVVAVPAAVVAVPAVAIEAEYAAVGYGKVALVLRVELC